MSQRQEAFIAASAESRTGELIDELPPAPVDVDELIGRSVLPAGLGVVSVLPPMFPPRVNCGDDGRRRGRLKQATV